MRGRGNPFSKLSSSAIQLPIIFRFKPRFIHIHDPELLLLYPIAGVCGVTVIYDMHEDFLLELRDKNIFCLSRRLQTLVWGLVEKTILRHVSIAFAERSYANLFLAGRGSPLWSRWLSADGQKLYSGKLLLHTLHECHTQNRQARV